MNKNTQYLFYVLLLIAIAITARISLYYLTLDKSEYTDLKTTATTALEIKKLSIKPLTVFKSYQSPENKKKTILDRIKLSVPLSPAEKNIILKEFGTKKGQTIPLTDAERISINKALNK